MRISPDFPRLRIIAVACWAIGGWWIVATGLLSPDMHPRLLTICMLLLGSVLFAIGIAFWTLSRDQHAGVMFDSKGLLLNLGTSAAFVAWEDIEQLGVSNRRSEWLTLGSAQQLGIRLRDPQPYLQSYEPRLPAGNGPLALTLRCIRSTLYHFQIVAPIPDEAQLARTRTRTGYDILVPEALLGGRATAFVQLVDAYRNAIR